MKIDGKAYVYLRQRQLALIFDENQPWIAPFAIQLASEYVVEILHDIERNFNKLREYIRYYNHYRIKSKLKGLSPVQYRTQPLRP